MVFFFPFFSCEIVFIFREQKIEIQNKLEILQQFTELFAIGQFRE